MKSASTLVYTGSSYTGFACPSTCGSAPSICSSTSLRPSDIFNLHGRAKLLEIQRENAILKKAVQIQNSKLNEKAGQDQEVQQLRQMLAQYQEQLGMAVLCELAACKTLHCPWVSSKGAH
eukprot:scaffold166281_cov19-Tisochrysis_lutea.AAC.1